MDWRWLGRLAGVVLFLGAAVVLLVGVQVRGDAARTGTCGSAWDVVAGRAAWPQWWAHDLTDPLDGSGGRPVRTVLCPSAVNRHIVASGGLALGAVAIMTAGEVVHRRRTPRTSPERRGPSARLALFGTVAKLAGGVLTVAGMVGIALLTADPQDPLFLYVSRTAVVLAGLLLLLPALLLVGIGWLASAMADQHPAAEDDRETP